MKLRTFLSNRSRTALLGGAVAVALAVTGQQAIASPGSGSERGTVDAALTQAAKEFQVPRDLLVAVGFSETHLDGHAGLPSQDNGYGVMHLVSNPERHTLEKAAELTGESLTSLKKHNEANIRGGAAVLRAYADQAKMDRADRAEISQWYGAVAHYGGMKNDQLRRLYADAVYDIVTKGVHAKLDNGQVVDTAARRVQPNRGDLAEITPLDAKAKDGKRSVHSEDYPAAHWVPANAANYAAGRTAAIDSVVIHVTQGSYAGTISWFQDPVAEVSAHYVVRSADGDITQMVRDADTAWHARSANSHALGIEHEGFVDDPSWFTDAMYRSSAALTKYLCDTYGIPKDRAHIVGHSEVPGNDHTDPGPNWNWDTYMSYVNS